MSALQACTDHLSHAVFPKDEEIPKETGIVRVGPRSSSGRFYEFWKLYLSPLNDEQVEQFVRKRYAAWQPGKRKKACKAIAKIPLLSARPMMLAFIPDLLETGNNIDTSFELYELLVEKWLQREKGWADPNDLRSFSEHLAVDLYRNRVVRESERIPGPELEPLAQKWRIKLKDWQLRGRSLLNRDSEGSYKFAHRSIMEYFVVKTLVSDSSVESVEAVDGPLTHQMGKFLDEFLDQKIKPETLEEFFTGVGCPLLFTHRVLMEKVNPRVRAHAGNFLANRGDHRTEVTNLDHMKFCFVPREDFWMGSDEYDDEKPPHLNKHLWYDYWISRFPITVAQYQLFVNATDHKPSDPDCLKDPANCPVRRVKWHEAIKYCEWLTQHWHEQGLLQKEQRVQLPSEAEWEKAARGGLHVPNPVLIQSIRELIVPSELTLYLNENPWRRYPWGEDKDVNRANYYETGIGDTSAIGCFPDGQSPYGCEEMAGNVCEWTRSLLGKKWEEPEFKYPYDPNDGRENMNAPNDVSRILRGGSFYQNQIGVRCACRLSEGLSGWEDVIGFRVVLSPWLLTL